MSDSFARIAYACQFWLVLLCLHVVWPQAGGQGHLDLMPWYWKLFLPLAVSGSVVAMTAAAASRESFWNRKSIAWLVVTTLLALAMALVTYYYHLHENDNLDESGPEEITKARSVRPAAALRLTEQR